MNGQSSSGAAPDNRDGRRVARGVVHVWVTRLDVDPRCVSSLLDVLSGEERVRAARLRTTELRLRFITAHGALRWILSRYLDKAAEAIRFETATLGKPHVAGPVSFNLSHSDDLAVVAVTENGRIGVDVERIRPMPDADDLVKRFFTPGEAQQYAAAPPLDRSATFFSTWTRKEAFLKATGVGLQQPLNSFEVDGAPSATCPRLVVLGAAMPDAPRFALRSFTPQPGYAAAVALDSRIDVVEFFDWTSQAASTGR